jgi:ABC-type cobalt transport system substrate-binding protein
MNDKLTPDYESYEKYFEPKEGKIEVLLNGKSNDVQKRIGNHVAAISLTNKELKELHRLLTEIVGNIKGTL